MTACVDEGVPASEWRKPSVCPSSCVTASSNCFTVTEMLPFTTTSPSAML